MSRCVVGDGLPGRLQPRIPARTGTIATTSATLLLVNRGVSGCRWCQQVSESDGLAVVVPAFDRGWFIVVARHAPDWWALTDEERQAVLGVLDRLHADSETALRVQFASGGRDEHAHLEVSPANDRLRDGPARPLMPALADLIASDQIDVADLVVAFVMVSGLRLLQPHLDAVLDRGGRIRLLTTDYLGVTEKAALEMLLARMREYGKRFEARVYRAGSLSFHPKAYLLASAGSEAAGFVGSANVSASGLRDGFEWSLETRDSATLSQMRDSFEDLWTSPQSEVLTQSLIDDFVEAERLPGADVVAVAPPSGLPSPTPVQAEALAALASARAEVSPVAWW